MWYRKGIMMGAALTLVIMAVVSFNWKSSRVHQPAEFGLAIRSIGHQLLLRGGDSITLVLPVQDLGEGHFMLNFQEPLPMNPDDLYELGQEAFMESGLTTNYLIEIRKCFQEEVLYGYQIEVADTAQNELTCTGRRLPDACYALHVTFLDWGQTNAENPVSLLWLCGLMIVALMISTPIVQKMKTRQAADMEAITPIQKGISLGNYQFFPEDRKLVIDQEDIELTGKELELLVIFTRELNQVITKDCLLKEVWEDKGVFVGRSLDMFISKLRKKLAKDEAIKIVNIRGVGYKLVVLA